MSRAPYLLCIDDYKPYLDTLEQYLKEHMPGPLRIEKAESGREGLELLEDLDAHGDTVIALIVDLMMPQMMGDEVIIHAHRSRPDILKFIVTGSMLEEDTVRRRIQRIQREARLDGCLAKSAGFQALGDAMLQVWPAEYSGREP